ncbi:MAG: hypothetical protein IKR56_02965 [Lachnospiraceae bacterium]|nr:hypothetical protein [Lachnospiraceae bacterium]
MKDSKPRSNYRPRNKSEESAVDIVQEGVGIAESNEAIFSGEKAPKGRPVKDSTVKDSSKDSTAKAGPEDDGLTYRELDDEGRYVDVTGDPVNEDYDDKERLRQLKEAEEYFRRILELETDDNSDRDDDDYRSDDHYRDGDIDVEEITEALEDLMDTIVQGADEIGQMIIDGIDDIISVI